MIKDICDRNKIDSVSQDKIKEEIKEEKKDNLTNIFKKEFIKNEN